ncbi:tricarballylate utilization 4Fe-4S protein TcuB [Dactylosporangium sp. CA-092794]|uniref:tricarballylate utilization 4Fe-4S protein TcuB n=1 Tax=Dactylosporangium sp. CA-092794 TaxID=3239929 RepID=UPI003D8AFE21
MAERFASPGPVPVEIGLSRAVLDGEAVRQLTVCNACRYCEGLCAVFPALARRSVLSGGDVSQIANLCHDCRACYDACMYSPPHEFAINLPPLLSAVRAADYRDYVWPHRVPRLLRGWSGVFAGALASAAVVVAAAVAKVGPAGLVRRHGAVASPYALISYPVLLVLLLVPVVYALFVIGAAARAYWRDTGGGRLRVRGLRSALWQAASLRYLRGGGGECYYPEDERPSRARWWLHMSVAYGFGLCTVSTLAAAVLQDVLDTPPPYPWLSVPVLTGVVGGVAMVVGCVGLIGLKARSSELTSFSAMTVKDYGFLAALAYLALTGLATLLTRGTAAYGLVYLLHLASVLVAFAATPYTKFVHIVYRLLALVRDNMERGANG